MMFRLSSTVSRALLTGGCGLLLTAWMRATSESMGAGTESMLITLAVFTLPFGLLRKNVAYPNQMVLVALAPALLIGFGDRLIHPLSMFLTQIGAIDVALAWWMLIGTTTWAFARVAMPGLRGNITGIHLAAAGGGVALGLALPAVVSAIVAGVIPIALYRTNLFTHPSDPRPSAMTPVRGALVLLSVTALTGTWAMLRSILDPTPSSALACVVGVFLGAALAHRLPTLSRSASAIGVALVIWALWLVAATAPTWAPQLVGLALSETVNLDVRWLLSTPFVGIGALTGVAIALVRPSMRLGCFATSGGLFLGPWLAGETALLFLVGGLGGTVGFLGTRLRRQAFGAALLLLAVVPPTFNLVIEPQKMVRGVYSQLRSPQALGTWNTPPEDHGASRRGWVPSGTSAMWSRADTTGEEVLESIHIALDGLPLHAPSRGTNADEFAGHLAAMLPRNPGVVVLSGDHLGSALRGLRSHPRRVVHISVPFPGILRTIAGRDALRRQAWIDPSVQLHPSSAGALLQRVPRAHSVVELSRGSWVDGARMNLGIRHFERVQRRLEPGGVYVLAIHLGWWPAGAPAALIRELDAVFKTVQLWLPPEGADTMILVASDESIPYERVAERFKDGARALDMLGIPTAEALAGSAVLKGEDLAAWEVESSVPPMSHLPATLMERPILHLADLPAIIETADPVWTSDKPHVAEAIAQVRLARSLVLQLIDNATRGRIAAAFDTARVLQRDHGESGATAIDALIAPHLADGRAALNVARPRGPEAKEWNDALRYATTARMLAPRSPQPWILLGDIALGRGNLPRALEHFETALSLDPRSVNALEGLARQARLRGDDVRAEAALRDTTRHAPRDWRTWHNLGIFFLELDRFENAAEALETASGLAPDDEIAPQLGLAKAHLGQGEATAALVRAGRAVQLAPEQGLAWYLRGRAHFDLDRYSEAEEDFRRAVLMDPELVEARGGIGQIRAIRGDYPAAMRQFKSVLEIDPDNAAARENLRRLQQVLPAEAMRP